jgi:hypothetical protein
MKHQHAPITVVQALLISWSKASRGGDPARKRNATPEAIPLPAESASGQGPSLLIHRAVFSEPDFSATGQAVEVRPGFTAFRFDCVEILPVEQGLQVAYQYHHGAGAPRRLMHEVTSNLVPLRKEAFLLRPGEWGRVAYNGRFSDVDDGSWWCERRVVNVGLLEDPPPDVFVRSSPSQVYSQLAKLR